MADVVDRCRGRIVEYDEMAGEIVLRVPYSDFPTLLRREYKEAIVSFVDSRPLSADQRKACWAMIGEISRWAGYDKDETKELMKLEFIQSIADYGDELFSLSNAAMSVVAAFQKWLARFIVNNDVPTKKSMLDYVDDVADYTFSCIVNKRCVCCGKKADLHHCDGSRVGMGRDRGEIIHLGSMVLPLCREHHTECHYSEPEFLKKWHLEPIEADKTICKIYGLKEKNK